MKIQIQTQEIAGFIAVAQSGSFSQAAQKTLRSQPAVSLQIKALEKEFKTRLFDRLGSQKVTLTDEGRLLYELLEPINRDIGQLRERFDEARNRLDFFSVSVASHNSAILFLLPNVVKTFKEKYPKARLAIVNRPRENILSMVEHDEVQMGITSTVKAPAWADYEVLGRFRRVLICGKRHPLKSAKNITLDDIARFPLILPPVGSHTRRAIDQAFRNKGITYDLALEVLGREAVKSFVEMGLGVSILSEYYLSGENRRNFAVKDVSEHFGFSESGLLARKGRHLNQAALHFMECVRSASASRQRHG